MVIKPGFMLILMGVAGALGCNTGPEFAVNERTFELPSMKPGPGGCMGIRLGRGPTETAATGASGAGSTLVTQASWGGEALVVRVSEGSTLLLERSYDEEFLRSGRVDEFTVTSSTGQSRLYRYWASYDENGQPRCAPLE